MEGSVGRTGAKQRPAGVWSERVMRRVPADARRQQFAQRKRDFQIDRLDRYDAAENCWKEAVIEDSRTPPPDQVAFRIGFPEWLLLLPSRNRRIAKSLALGYTTSEVAKRFWISAGRVSQLRHELNDSWLDFLGEQRAS